MRVGDRIEKRFANYDKSGNLTQEGIWKRGWLVSKKGMRGCYIIRLDSLRRDTYARPEHLQLVGSLDQLAEIKK